MWKRVYILWYKCVTFFRTVLCYTEISRESFPLPIATPRRFLLSYFPKGRKWPSCYDCPIALQRWCVFVVSMIHNNAVIKAPSLKGLSCHAVVPPPTHCCAVCQRSCHHCIKPPGYRGHLLDSGRLADGWTIMIVLIDIHVIGALSLIVINYRNAER